MEISKILSIFVFKQARGVAMLADFLYFCGQMKIYMRFLLPVILFLPCFLCVSCSDSDAEYGAATSARSLAGILAPQASNPYDNCLDSAPDSDCVRIRINPIGTLRKVFNDSNHVQLQSASQIGFRPITRDTDILHLNRPVQRVASCEDYYIDNLTHSYPYLVPEAADLLADIGRAFRDSLDARGGGAYRIKVTSLLRTQATVKKLRRVNRNATGESTHSYGTTFDISYSKFICDDVSAPHRTFEDLKNLLAEVLLNLRQQGRCYVKYEVKQSCFHITVRPQSQPYQ